MILLFFDLRGADSHHSVASSRCMVFALVLRAVPCCAIPCRAKTMLWLRPFLLCYATQHNAVLCYAPPHNA
jgi:hypothetical protein